MLAWSQGDNAHADSLFRESLLVYQELKDQHGISYASYGLGRVALTRHNYDQARRLFEESASIQRRVGDKWALAYSLEGLARAAFFQGEDTESLQLLDDTRAMASCLEGWAGMVVRQGEVGWAAQLWGAAEALRESVAVPIPQVERTNYENAIATARTHLGEQAFVTAWAQGRMMTPEQAIAARGQKLFSYQSDAQAQATKSKRASSSSLNDLTEREVEVLRLVARGLSDAQVAEFLVISPRTVNAHLRSIYSKLNISSRHAATLFALERQLI
ncbi:MAG: LuxR C-terminal-related transcriptional regulator [Ktedonobacteraceae bacterium]